MDREVAIGIINSLVSEDNNKAELGSKVVVISKKTINKDK